MRLRLQLLATFIFSVFLIACTEDQDFDTDKKTVDITLDNAELITLGVFQSAFLANLYLPFSDFLSESDLPEGAVKVESIDIPVLAEGAVLSCQDFPVRVSDDVGTALYCFDNPHGGVGLYSFPVGGGSNQIPVNFPVEPVEKAVGDQVTVEYDNYVNDLGWVYNGRLDATYTNIEGLSRDFVEIDTVSCLANLQSDLSGNTRINETDLLAELIGATDRKDDLIGDETENELLNGVTLSSILSNRDPNLSIGEIRITSEELNAVFAAFDPKSTVLGGITVIDVVGESVFFFKLADTLELQVEVYGKVQILDGAGKPVLDNENNPTFVIAVDDDGSPILDSDGNVTYVRAVIETHILAENETAIVINHPREQAENSVTSVNGDQVFSVVNRTVQTMKCQHFERELNTILTGFSVEKDGISYGIDGRIKLVNGTNEHNSFVNEIRDSSFTTTVKQEESVELFEMGNYSIARVQDLQSGPYVFDMRLDGNISSSSFPGLLTVTLTNKLVGLSGNDHPSEGAFSIFAQGLEQISILIEGLTVHLFIDYNGDTTGNGRTDADFGLDTSWEDLLNRDFIQPDPE